MEEVVKVADAIRDAVRTAYLPYANRPATYTLEAGSEAGYAMDVGPFVDMCCSGAVMVLCGPKRVDDLAALRGGFFRQPYAVVVLRCAPSLDEMGNPPTAAVKEAAVELWHDDMRVVRQALRSYLSTVPDMTEPEITNYEESQIDPQGGCGGSMITFELSIMEDC